jgi:hypothetical protein
MIKPHPISNISYLYLYSSLKDSYVRGDTLLTELYNGIYTAPLKSFHKELSRRTTRGTLPLRYKILEGKGGSPTELRLIIRIPPDWTPQRFQEEALKLWEKNASVEEVITCLTRKSVDMDLGFLTKGWNGPQKLTGIRA